MQTIPICRAQLPVITESHVENRSARKAPMLDPLRHRSSIYMTYIGRVSDGGKLLLVTKATGLYHAPV